MPGGTFEPCDVVVVPFPFTDRAATRRRPALVVSSRQFNAAHDQLVLTMITSAAKSNWPSDVKLQAWRSAGLKVACRVRLKLFTIDKALIVRRLGTLADGDRTAVVAALAANLTIA